MIPVSSFRWFMIVCGMIVLSQEIYSRPLFKENSLDTFSSVKLEGILFFSPTKWTVWINQVIYSSDRPKVTVKDFPGVLIHKVTQHGVTLSLVRQGKSCFITLSPHHDPLPRRIFEDKNDNHISSRLQQREA